MDEASPRDPLCLMAEPFTGGEEWRRLLPLLDGGFDVVRELPPRGSLRGSSDGAPPQDERVERELLRRDLYPAHVVAAGFAAAGAIRLARRRPEMLRSLVLFEPIVRTPRSAEMEPDDDGELETRFAPVVAAVSSGDGALARAAWDAAHGRRQRSYESAAAAADESPQRWAALWRHPRDWTVHAPEMAEFLPPVLVVDTQHAPEFLHRTCERLAAGFPNVTRVVLPSAGTEVLEADPRRIAAVLFGFCLERNVPSA